MTALKRGFFAFLIVTAVVLVARVATSFAFVAGSIGHTLASTPEGGQQLGAFMTDALRGFPQMAGTLAPGRRQTASVLDIPAELEAQRKARGVQRLPGGPLVLSVGE